MANERPGEFNMTNGTPDNGVPLRERYERFCGAFVETRNPMQAMRLAFVVDKHQTAEWVQQRAERLLRDPGIKARVQELKDIAAAETLTTIKDLLQDWHDIATADPNELVCVRRLCCEHCYGVGFARQWRDEAQYLLAVAVAIDKKQPMPSSAGGYGFDASKDANPACPHCYGDGHAHVHVADTTKLRGAARKLYAGAQQDRFGCIKITMHDQQKAREMLANCLGALKSAGVGGGILTPETAPSEKPRTADEASKSYLRLIKGGKVA